MSVIARPALDPPKDLADANHIIGAISTGTNSRPLESILPPLNTVRNRTALARPKVNSLPKEDTSAGQLSAGIIVSSLIASPSPQDLTRSADPANLNIQDVPKLVSQETSAWTSYNAQPPKSNMPIIPYSSPQKLGKTEEEGRHLYYSTAGPDDFNFNWVDFAIQSWEIGETINDYFQQSPRPEDPPSTFPQVHQCGIESVSDYDLVEHMGWLSVREKYVATFSPLALTDTSQQLHRILEGL